MHEKGISPQRQEHILPPSMLPVGNSPEQLALSPEGRRMLKKEIVFSMVPIWTHVGKLPEDEIRRLGNNILTTEMPRKQLVKALKRVQSIKEALKDRLPPQIPDFEL